MIEKDVLILYENITGNKTTEEDYWWIKDWILDREEVLRYDVDWNYLSLFLLPVDFIRVFSDKLNWMNISYKRISEEIIREFQNYIYWQYIPTYNNISEEFIDEFHDKEINWYNVFSKLHVSKKFKEKYKDKYEEYCKKVLK